MAWWRAVRVRWRTSPGGTDPPVADLRTRAALTVAMALGIPAFQAHISRSIGTDILSPEGDRRVIPAVLDIQSHPTISLDAARTLREGLDKPHA
jgi:TetR/AcrR family transcriptional regulator, regulator of cefoperazone and chloramphenicol sensitivity